MMIGVDVRSTEVVAVAVDESGAIRSRASVDAKASDRGAALVDAFERITPVSGASSLGVAASNVDVSVSRALESLASRYPVLFEQHATIGRGTAAAVAEGWTGSARGVADVVYFGVAEHATAGVIRGGHAVCGAHGREPSIGWLSLNPVEREDYRKVGCLEAEVAAAGIVRRLIWRVKAGDRSRVQDAVKGDLAAITADLVFEAARGKDGVSISVIRDTAKYLGMAAANLVVMADPAMLVLGGLMASASDVLLEPVIVDVGRRLPAAMTDSLKICAASLGEDAAAIGAARHAAGGASQAASSFSGTRPA